MSIRLQKLSAAALFLGAVLSLPAVTADAATPARADFAQAESRAQSPSALDSNVYAPSDRPDSSHLVGRRSRCVLQQIGEFKLDATSPWPVVTAKVNGKPVRLAVDTGSYLTLLFPKAAARLGLQVRELSGMPFWGSQNTNFAPTANVARLEVGGLVGRNIDLFVPPDQSAAGKHAAPEAFPAPAVADLDGVLGAGFLLQSDVEFDLPQGVIRFFRPQNCSGDAVIYWNQPYAVLPLKASQSPLNVSADDTYPLSADPESLLVDQSANALLTEVRINGAPIGAELDTGAARTFLFDAQAAVAHLSPDGGPDIVRDGPGVWLGHALYGAHLARFHAFALDQEVIHGGELLVTDPPRSETVTATGSRLGSPIDDPGLLHLGADFFRAHRVYVSKAQHRVYITYEGGPAFEPSSRTGPAKTGP